MSEGCGVRHHRTRNCLYKNTYRVVFGMFKNLKKIGKESSRRENMESILYLVIPCYNEQEVLKETARQLEEKLGRMICAGLVSEESKVVFVNDGSKDQTWKLIEELHRNNPMFTGIHCKGSAGISIFKGSHGGKL